MLDIFYCIVFLYYENNNYLLNIFANIKYFMIEVLINYNYRLFFMSIVSDREIGVGQS